jgi:hypothetical protein
MTAATVGGIQASAQECNGTTSAHRKNSEFPAVRYGANDVLSS